MAAASPDQSPSSGDRFAGGEPLDGGGSGCSTPFVSAPSSPTRDPFGVTGGCFFSAPASPTRGGGGDFDFDFSSRFPPSAAAAAAAAMSSADELFHNGQIRPVRLSSLLLRPQALPPLLDLSADEAPPPPEAEEADERGRYRNRSVRRKARSLSPFRTRYLSPLPRPVPIEPEATPAASRSSSSSSSASSASSTSSRTHRRWGFLKDLLHRSKSDGGKQQQHPPPPPPPPTAEKRNPSPAGARGRGRRRRSAHERLYEARRAEAEELRRRTYLPYRQGLLLFGCLGLGSRGYGAVHGLARGLNAATASKS